MRKCVAENLARSLEQAAPGRALEIGGFETDKSARDLLTARGFSYRNLDIEARTFPDTVIADICTDDFSTIGLEAGSFDFICSMDVFEHLERPWVAAGNIVRLLAPGGVAFTSTVWAWRYHPLPIDFWRFSPDCLAFLFKALTCIEADFDLSDRRKDLRGFWENKKDHVPIDELGGWRENWGVYFLGRKDAAS